MCLSNQKLCYFCVSSPDFEQSKKVDVIIVKYEETFVRNLIVKAMEFWERAIWPVLTSL